MTLLVRNINWKWIFLKSFNWPVCKRTLYSKAYGQFVSMLIEYYLALQYSQALTNFIIHLLFWAKLMLILDSKMDPNLFSFWFKPGQTNYTVGSQTSITKKLVVKDGSSNPRETKIKFLQCNWTCLTCNTDTSLYGKTTWTESKLAYQDVR